LSKYRLKTILCDYVYTTYSISEVNIPSQTGIHFCDPLWTVYDQCVEVRFAVVRFNVNGVYIMVRERLEEMWNTPEYQTILLENSFCPYTPPAPIINVDSWLWVAGVLGIILFFLIIFCFAWLRHLQDNLRRR